MSTSVHGGRVRYRTADVSTDDPYSVAHVQSIVNNLLHFADEASQVRVAWSLETGETALTANLQGKGASNGIYHKITECPFPLNINTDGTPYSLRMRIAGASSDNTTQVDLVCAVAPITEGHDAINSGSASTDGWIHEKTTSSTSAWLTGTSSHLVTIPEGATRRGTGTQRTTDTDGGNAVDITWVLMMAHVWGKSADTSASEAQLTGLYIAEYVGV